MHRYFTFMAGRKSLNDCTSLAEVKVWIRESDTIAAAIPNQRPWLVELETIETKNYLRQRFDKKSARRPSEAQRLDEVVSAGRAAS